MYRLFVVLVFLVFSISCANAQNNVTVYASATDVSTWNAVPCDGTFTFWIEGTSQPYYHEYTITGPGGPYLINTIDTLVTLTGLCPGTYWGNVSWIQPCYDTSLVNNCTNCSPIICDTLLIPCPLDSCTNCSGAGGANGGAGAGAAVGAPPPPLDGYIETYLPECAEFCAYSEFDVFGGTPPYQYVVNGTFQSGTISGPVTDYYVAGVCCSGIPTSITDLTVQNSVTITDATGQSITVYPLLYGQWGVHFCALNPWAADVQDIEVCSGETITFHLAPSQSWYNDPNSAPGVNNVPLTYTLYSSNSQIGLPSWQQIQSFAYTNWYTHTITYTAPQVTSNQVSNLSYSGAFGNFCPSGSDFFTITVHPPAVIDAGSDQTACDGEMITLSGIGGVSYTWDGGISDNIPFNAPSSNNVYTVTGTDANGCQNTDQVEVVVNPLPSIDAGQDQAICEGTMITLLATGEPNHSWDNGVIDGVPFAPPLGTNTYTVTAISPDGCSHTDQVVVTVNANPIADAGPDQVVCNGAPIILSGPSGLNNIWDNGVIDGVAFSQTTSSVTYTLTSTGANGCQNTDQVDITVNSLPAVDAGIDQAVCEGDQITLSGLGATIYTWNNGVSDNLAFTPIAGTTTYEVTGTDANGCQNTDQVEVVVNPLPSIDAGQDQAICEGTMITLLATGEPNHSWDNGVIDGVPFAPPLGTNTYTVTAISPDGCSHTDQVVVTVNALPIIDAGADQTICDGDQVTLSGSGGASYTWNNGVTDNVNFAPAIGTTTYEVTGTDANGCQNIDQVDVLVNPLPAVDAGIDQTVCDGDQVTLLGSGANTLVWNNNVTDNVAFTPTAGTTTYEVTGTDANGCQNTDQVDVTVNPLPVIDAGVDQTVCDGDQVTLSGSGGVNYIWDFGVQNDVAFAPPAGINVYAVIGTDVNGCENIDNVEVTVEPVPTVSFIGFPLEGCSPLDVELTNTTPGTSVDCIWTISGGPTLSGCGTVSTQLTETGYYDVTLSIATLGGCFASETYNDYIYIEPDPIADFTFFAEDVTTLHPEVQFTNQSSGASTYWWDFNDSSFGTGEIHPLHLFPDEATTYVIDLTAYSDLGCVDSVRAEISIQEELIYYVPNSFSPDGDQHNNVFEPVFHSGFDPYSFEMKIFNRWGELIFTTNDAKLGWDGTYLGRMVQDGVYTWSIKFKRKNNDEYMEDRGHVNLLR